MHATPWEFWIDVGGTFTDCFGRRPDGTLVRHKCLSSGVTKGTAAEGSSRGQIVDPLRGKDPPEFWDGYRLRLLDAQGRTVAEGRVAQFEQAGGVLELDPPLAAQPQAGQAYELFSGEEAPILAIRYLLGLRLDQPIPPVAVRLGTTRGTNALLTRRGAKTAFVTTRGFGDVLLHRLSEPAAAVRSGDQEAGAAVRRGGRDRRTPHAAGRSAGRARSGRDSRGSCTS